jgi:deoxyadenosine/deoxycytidine kinase
MNPEYIESLVEAYNHFFFHYDDSPLLIVNANEIDFVNDEEQMNDLFQHIVNAPEGTSYYNPGRVR